MTCDLNYTVMFNAESHSLSQNDQLEEEKEKTRCNFTLTHFSKNVSLMIKQLMICPVMCFVTVANSSILASHAVC